MARAPKVTVSKQGRRYRLGQTDEYGGIWRKRPWGWRLVSRYPLTEEGWRVANDQFAMWEPNAEIDTPREPVVQPNVRHRRPWLIPTAVVLGGLLIAGGTTLFATRATSPENPGSASGSPTSTQAPAVGTGYLATGTDFVIFIQWNDTNGSLRGSAQAVTATGQAPDASTSSETLSVTGSLHGSNITLSFDGSASTFGTLSGGTFTINFPQSNGSLQPVSFSSSSAKQYNTALDRLDAAIRRANAIAANAQRLQQEEQKINQDASAVTTDIAGLAQDSATLVSDSKAIAADLQGNSQDLSATEALAQQVEAEATTQGYGSGSSTCGDAESVGGDAESVNGDAETIEGDAESITADISSIRSEIAGLQSDFTAFQSDESSLPGYDTVNPPTQQQVTAAVQNADAAIAESITTTNGFISQANSDVSAAFGYAAAAFQAGACGQAPSAPAPQSEISPQGQLPS